MAPVDDEDQHPKNGVHDVTTAGSDCARIGEARAAVNPATTSAARSRRIDQYPVFESFSLTALSG